MKTTYLIGLLVAGFVMLFLGWPWWLGVGIIILSMAAAVTGEEAQQLPMAVKPVVAAGKPVQVAERPVRVVKKEEDEAPGSVTDPLHFRPTIPPDGVAGIGSIGPPKGTPEFEATGGIATVGKRTGTFSFYPTGPADPANPIARVRIKDDIRVNMPFMDVTDASGMKPFTSLFTAHFRTGKPMIKTKCLEPTFETWKTSFDEWAKEE